MNRLKKAKVGKFVKYIFLGLYIAASGLAIAEASLPGTISANQSNSITGNFNDNINDIYDEDNVKNLANFSVEFSNESKNVKVGDKIKYTVNYEPEDTSYKGVKVSGDTSYFTINSDSSITFTKAKDNLNIYFTSVHNENLVKKYTFNVSDIKIEKIEIVNKLVQAIDINSTYQLKYEIFPSNATNKDVVFSSSNLVVVSISEKGLIKGLKEGKSTIKVASLENSEINDSFIVEVKAKEDNIDKKVESIFVNDVNMYALQDKYTSKIIINPIDASFDPSRLKISNYGDLTINVSNTNLIIQSNNKNEDKLYKDILLEYKTDENQVINTTFDVNVTSKKYLDIDDVSKDKLITSYSPNINYINEICSIDTFTINIPYNISNSKEYVLNNYMVEYDTNNLNLISSSYNKLVFKLKNSTSKTDGEINYYFDKNTMDSYLTFHYEYQEIHSTVSLESISLNSLYTDLESSECNCFNKLYLNIPEENIFKKFSIMPSQYSNTDVFLNVTNGKNNIEFYDANRNLLDIDSPINLRQINEVLPIKVGKVNFELISGFDKQGLNLNDLNYTLEIVDVPNISYLTSIDNDGIASEITSNFIELGVKDVLKVKMEFEFSNKFKDGYISNYKIDYLYQVQVSNSNVVYSSENNVVSPINIGTSRLEFIVKNVDNLSKYLDLNITYIPIDMDAFSLTIDTISYPKENIPDINNGIFAIGTTMQIGSIINDNATYKDVIYSSSNPNIISINNSGYATCLSKGTCQIICQSKMEPDVFLTKTIKVVDATSSFSLDNSKLNAKEFKKEVKDGITYYSITLLYGKSYQLVPKMLEYATSTNIRYECLDDSNVVSIDYNGQISLKGVGEAKYKMTYGGEDSLKSYSVFIYFNIVRDTNSIFKQFALFVRKSIGHFGLFFFIGFLSCVYMVIQFKSYISRLIAASCSSLIGFIIAGLTEIIQYFVPGRGCTLADVGIDMLGYISAMIIFVIVVSIIFMLKKRKAKTMNKTYSYKSKPDELEED